MDVLTPEQRSYNMASIRGSDTKPEMALRKQLFAMGFRYRCNYRVGAYKVDIAFPSQKVAVMVDGCFWHCCPRCFRMPETNVHYWRKKFRENRLRDKRATKVLEKQGWTVLRFWEHEVLACPEIAGKRLLKMLSNVFIYKCSCKTAKN